MSYVVMVFRSKSRTVSTKEVDTIDDARNTAQRYVNEAMEAFGDDRQALKDYGYLAAEEQAMDMPEEGGTIFLSANGVTIEVINQSESEDE